MANTVSAANAKHLKGLSLTENLKAKANSIKTEIANLNSAISQKKLSSSSQKKSLLTFIKNLSNSLKTIIKTLSQTTANSAGKNKTSIKEQQKEINDAILIAKLKESEKVATPSEVEPSKDGQEATVETVIEKATIDPKEGYSDDNLSLSTSSDGTAEIFTSDGYVIGFTGKEQTWSIMDPDGRANKIWGDPHVIESDGDKWDFKERSSFLFGTNKITVETVPAPNGQTFSSKVIVYNGESRIAVSGIDKDKLVFENITKDALVDDTIREDGDIFILSKEDNGEDRFVLLKDSAEKFDPQFIAKVGIGDEKLLKNHLNEEQFDIVKSLLNS